MTNKNSIKYIIELDKIFEQKNWKQKDNYEQVFETLSNFGNIIFEKDDEFTLILELLERFHWISLNDYYNNCRKLLISIVEDLNHHNQNIYAFPIIKKKHEGKVKSGTFISYLIKSLLPTIPNSEKIKFEDFNFFTDIEKLRLKKSDIFLLVDDFIGSGETLEECINEINSINSKIIENTRILTIAIRKDTLDRISKKYNIYYNLEVLKGISDYNTGLVIENKKKIMQDLENRIFSRLSIKDYSLGYQQSESLISLLRTPDNTFPIFWSKYKKNIKLIPPFPRYEKT